MKKYNRLPTYYAGQAYDTALAIGAALEGRQRRSEGHREVPSGHAEGGFPGGSRQVQVRPEPASDPGLVFDQGRERSPTASSIIKTVGKIFTDKGDVLLERLQAVRLCGPVRAASSSRPASCVEVNGRHDVLPAYDARARAASERRAVRHHAVPAGGGTDAHLRHHERHQSRAWLALHDRGLWRGAGGGADRLVPARRPRRTAGGRRSPACSSNFSSSASSTIAITCNRCSRPSG